MSELTGGLSNTPRTATYVTPSTDPPCLTAGAARRVEARAGTDARRETDVLGDEVDGL